ncbi:type 2 periplasmic-binding domain-containing protein [Verminephrobacter eiseniae]|uniref:tripartite tricarboxylate transporter substrate-binding protein n=1 Tax=Verminephrobacter eiseniae TaxID=364317 RepID=UPI0022382ABA|nr:tripartite tricarboxylate transporter substrate-binding protein [Verminephrobacter eiseniae]
MNYASVGPGSSNHLTAEYFKAVSGTFVTHIGTPRAVIDRWQTEVRKIVTEPAFQQRLREQGLAGIANTPEQFAAALRTEQDKWIRLVRERRLSLE